MKFVGNRTERYLAFIFLFLVTSMLSAYPLVYTLAQGEVEFKVGGFHLSNQGRAQSIHIQTLIGNDFSVVKRDAQNVMFGMGYFLNGQQFNHFRLQYGLHAFYLTNTTVYGLIKQEHVFTNLKYHYNVANLPIYVMARGLFNLPNERYHLTVDFGLGPTIKLSRNYTEKSLDGGVTLPDQLFKANTQGVFSVMTGLNIKLDHLFHKTPLICGYHLFYLGNGQFKTRSNQVLTSLKTGKSYAQALSCGLSF